SASIFTISPAVFPAIFVLYCVSGMIFKVKASSSGSISNNEMVNELFNRGGLLDMMYTVSMTIVAMTFAGILEYTGMLRAIMNQILKIAKGTLSIISATIVSRSEEHTSELQSRFDLVCRLLLEKKNTRPDIEKTGAMCNLP